MKIALFDWTVEGHHRHYVRKVARELSTIADVVAAVPDEMIDCVADLPVDVFPLGESRPSIDHARPLAAQNERLAHAELDLFQTVAERVRPDHLFHLYADPIIRRLVERPSQGVPVSLVLFFPRTHYPSAYGATLTPAEYLRAWFQAWLVGRWRRRPDAHALFTLDEEAVRRWSRQNGAPAFWMPEPPVTPLPLKTAAENREGCVLYGALAPRKGIELLTRAISLDPMALKVLLAGPVEPGFEGTLANCISEMERAGARVELRNHRHDEQEGLAALASGRCAVLPYPRHFGMSRVLLEAAAAGTPVIAHDWGLLGDLVRRHNLGAAVDCTNPQALRRALLRLCDGSGQLGAYASSLAGFEARFSAAAFREAVIRPFQNGKRARPLRRETSGGAAMRSFAQ